MENPNRQKLSIAVSSGGMKGMFTLGVLHGLRTSLSDVAEITGSSSGALNAAYFLTGQTDTAREIYTHLVTTDFIDKRNMPPRMRIEYVWELVFAEGSPYRLDVEALMNSAADFRTPLLNVKSGKQEIFTNHDEPERFIEGLKASIAVPVWYGGVVRVDGHDYIDGGAINPFPLNLLHRRESQLIGISTKRKPFLYAPNRNAHAYYAQRQYGVTKKLVHDMVETKVANVAETKLLAMERQARIIVPTVAFYQLSDNMNLLDSAFRQGVALATAREDVHKAQG